MSYSRRLGPPLVAASVATIVAANVYVVWLLAAADDSALHLFRAVWPVSLTSTVAIVLVMSFLYHALIEIIADMESRERKALELGMRDPLTGLANRILLEDRLARAISKYKRYNEEFSLLMLDLDHFKKVNDVLGHQTGDELLREVSRRLQSLARDTDTVARIGGDEFVVIQDGVRTPRDTELMCTRLLASLSSPYLIDGREIVIGASIGCVGASQSCGSAAEFFRRADIALYRAKDEGRNCFKCFSESMDAEIQRKAHIEETLRRALAKNEGLEVHFQPQIDVFGKIQGLEALIRWQHPVYGMLQPSEFIPIAEEVGLICKLSEFVFDKSCQIAARYPNLFIAVNVSPLQFTEKAAFCETLKQIASKHDVRCDQFEIEITEHAFIRNIENCEENIMHLRDAGFSIALDDFGTGYSSLSYLRRFHVDKIKLDKSFADEESLQNSVAVIRGVVMLAHSLGLDVVAEGIESAEQEQIALESGCDGLQGYRYGEAVHPSNLGQILEENRAAA